MKSKLKLENYSACYMRLLDVIYIFSIIIDSFYVCARYWSAQQHLEWESTKQCDH